MSYNAQNYILFALRAQNYIKELAISKPITLIAVHLIIKKKTNICKKILVVPIGSSENPNKGALVCK